MLPSSGIFLPPLLERRAETVLATPCPVRFKICVNLRNLRTSLSRSGRACLALHRREEALADFTTAAGAKFQGSAVRRLARQALAEMKAVPP